MLWSVLGSAAAGALFTHLLGHFGSAWINERLPRLKASKHWRCTWWAGVSTYGFVTLAAVAASPFAQTPALVLAALLGLPVTGEVFGALLLGKGPEVFPGGRGHRPHHHRPLATAPQPLPAPPPIFIGETDMRKLTFPFC